jgi:energy-coupling factor transporter transmembrane protein EcfT
MRIISERISITENADKTSIVILGKLERWKESLLLFWLLAWTFCGTVFIYYYLFPTPYQYSVVMLIFLIFWIYFELKIAKIFLWRRSGFEFLEFANGNFSIKNSIHGYGKLSNYDIREIKSFEKINFQQKNFFAFMDQSFWVLGGDRIYFKYNGKDIIFGKQIIEEEQNALIQILNGALKKEKRSLNKKSRNENNY